MLQPNGLKVERVFLQKKSLTQVAALPLMPAVGRADLTSLDVLLITSRRRGHWLLPKGWPKKNATMATDAQREAVEEAGVLGPVGADAVGTYKYKKKMRAGYNVRCEVLVFPMLVLRQQLDWPERAIRQQKWLPMADAADEVHDAHLAKLLRRLATREIESLVDFVESQDVHSWIEKWSR